MHGRGKSRGREAGRESGPLSQQLAEELGRLAAAGARRPAGKQERSEAKEGKEMKSHEEIQLIEGEYYWAKLVYDERPEIVQVLKDTRRNQLYARYMNGRQEYGLKGKFQGPIERPVE